MAPLIVETQVYIPVPQTGSLSPSLHKMSDPKERFYRHFQTEITSIQEQISELARLSTAGGERKDGIDHILAGISRLSNEVQDALDYVPAYDQRAYSQAIKALTEKLNEATGKLAPRNRFQFKKRAAAAAKPAEAQQLDTRRLVPKQEEESAVEEEGEQRDSVGGIPSFGKNYNEELSKPDSDPNSHGVRKPSFSSAKNVVISEQTGLHIMLPSTASHATSSGSLASLERCIVDMTVPTMSGAPFAGLAVKDVRQSILLCGTVAGPVHITGVKNSAIVVAARQVRVHECEGVDLYLHCSSHPIIEDCKRMRFAPLPTTYASKVEETLGKNHWDQVDDFKWLKTEHSPNWSVMPKEKRLKDEVWSKTVCGNPSLSTDDILRQVGILEP